ncbi:MAG: hypothetical protein GY847_15695, partial [Proteobacteria bacterium]|nr:hypothetical protein [Pseudomonadota bacterium]
RVLEEEAARGFKDKGVYRKRLRHFVDGIALGSESYVLEQVARLRESGQYKRRKNAVRQLGGIHMSVREQRKIAAVF